MKIKFFAKKTDTIKNTIKLISKSSQKCLVVLDENKKLIGTISDGDIRKVILKKLSLSNSIKNIYNTEPKFLVDNRYTYKDVKEMFSKYNLDIIPVINKFKKVEYIFDRNFIFSKFFKISQKFKIPVIIMAGGKGTRLKPITNIIPKPLVPYKGIPVIERIFSNFSQQGLNNFYLTLNFKSRIIATYLKELNNKNFTIKILNEKKPMGTASSLKLLSKIKKDNFFVTNCDVLFNLNYFDLLKFHSNNKNSITLVGAKKIINIPYGVCKTQSKNKLKKIEEKPSVNYTVSTGLYIVNTKILKLIPKNKEYNFDKFISDAIKRKYRVGVYEIDDKSWIDVGDWSGFKKNINF